MMKFFISIFIFLLISGCSTKKRKFPDVYRWAIQKTGFKKYDGFDTLLVLDPSIKNLPKLKANHNTVLGYMKLEGEGLTQKMDILISSGFDGAYFVPGSIPADEVITLIHYTRMIHPDFLFIIENIHQYKNKELHKLVNAYALTDMLLKKEGGVQLNDLLKKKKAIFSLEFLRDKKALVEYAGLAKEKGLLPLVGHRPLKGKFIYADQLFHLARPCD